MNDLGHAHPDLFASLPQPVAESAQTRATDTMPRQRIDGLRKVIAVFRRRWLVFTAIFLFVVGATAFFTWRQTPLFTATANLVVNSRLLNVSSKDQDIIPTLPTQDGAVDTEIQILRSREVLERTVRSLDLVNKGEFVAALAAVPQANRIGAAAAIMKDNLAVVRPGVTNVVTISYTSPYPSIAKDVADEVGKQYLQVKTDTRLGVAETADEGLSRQLETLRGQVQKAEQDVAQYKAANNLLSSEGVTLTEQEISIYKQQVASARATLAEERARLNTARAQLRRGSKGDDVGEALNSQVIEQLRNQRSQISTKLAELRARYRPEHPDVIKAQRQLDDIDGDIEAEIRRVISNLEARTEVASQRASAASGTASSATGALASNNAATVRLNELERRAEAYRSNYAAMLERQNAISTQATIADEDARIFSPASEPRFPSSPNKPINLVIGGLLGLVLASLTLWLLHLFDRGIITSSDAEARLGLPHLANIPSINSIARGADRQIPAENFVVERPLSLYAESLRGLRLSLIQSNTGRPIKLIGITSSCPGEGKSTLALSLARTAALAGDRALLIDGDIRRPSIARMLGFAPENGFIDVLSGKVSFEETAVKDPLTDLIVLATPVRAFSPKEIFRGEAMDMLFDRLRKQFDIIIVDTAPALAASDTRAMLEHLDKVAMAVRWKKTLLPLIKAALQKMRPLHIMPAGVVLTQVNMKAVAAYGYGDVDFNYRSYEAYTQ